MRLEANRDEKIFIAGLLNIVLIASLVKINAARANSPSRASRLVSIAAASASGVNWGQVGLNGFGDPSTT
jgi:hypothetical protein